MLERIIKFCLERKVLIISAAALIIAVGIYSYLKLPVDAFPDVTNIQVEIVSEAPGLSALEIERFVTYPVEMAMRGIPGLEQMRSVTKFGISVVTIVFKDDVDIYFARQLVSERLGEAKENMPEGVETSMGPVATAMGEIYQFTLEGKEPQDPQEKVHYLANLRTLEEWVVNPALKNVAGVSDINSFGGYFKQFQVIVSPEKLVKYNLSVNDVYEAVEKNNQNVGGNILDRYSEEYIVRGVGLIKSEEDIRNIVLKSSGGTPVFVRDVADIRVGEAVRQGASLKNGSGEIVGGIVMMLKGENGREVVERVKAKVKEINESNLLPDGIKIKPYYDRSDIVQTSVNTVTRALLEGSILVLVILYLLLRNFRGAFVVLLALPLSLFMTFIVMKLIGVDANLMSLGGLSISIGMIIDATIIQVENVQRHLSESGAEDRKLSTVLKSVIEVRKPSIFGELIIAVTFLPILSLQGLEGKMFTPLAVTVAIALLSSLLLSIFIIPTLCGMFLKPDKEKANPVLDGAKKIYFPILNWSLSRKKAVIASAVAMVAVAVILLTQIGTEFMPVMDEGAFDMDVQLLPGVSLEKSLEVNKMIGEKLKRFPELETVVSRTGRTGIAVEANGVDKTGYVGVLRPRSEWKNARTREELTEKMRQSIATIPGIGFGFSQPIQCRIDELVAGTKAQLIIKLFGEDMQVLKEKADEIAKSLSRIDGATDMVVEQVAGQPYLAVNVDRAKIARYGLNVSDVLKAVEITIGGKAATQLYEENRSFDITVRYPEEYRNSVDAIGSLLVPTGQGYNVPLKELADISIVDGPVQVSREDGLRRIGIEMNIHGRDIGSFVAEAKKSIRENVKLPSGYFLTWGGQFENQQRAMSRLMIIAPLAIALILVLLFVTFKSLRLALLVISNLPFALIGGVIALYISGLYLSVPASIGFVVLFGVAVLNGVVLVSYISQLRHEGMELKEAIMKGCNDRLRPVLMTASIAIFSLIPMLFATGPGSEVQRPLATVVVGGLFTSTLLTLIVIPTLYGWFENIFKKS
ncbi:MAG: efflux RND transporter permease subunit [Ignavibacteria bacterium]|jgi:cobalt-zinc-cadmium resistance protein CzcA|nr:efflux RND transporter permease subunit [Ignavibacteria bacterium]MCU7504670.1 efflux RND transporter permease subunit [Ignavibacteria bacterium]MCU7517522.1 efflux RND transporter permease subunit [Ignavibacteria bacterium]